jgi:uncharacterized membrane protein
MGCFYDSFFFYLSAGVRFDRIERTKEQPTYTHIPIATISYLLIKYLIQYTPKTSNMYIKGSAPFMLAIISLMAQESLAFQTPQSPHALFPVASSAIRSKIKHSAPTRVSMPLYSAIDEHNERSVNADIWNPSIRNVITGMSAVGALETGYLSYVKLYVPDGIKNICGDASSSAISSCGSVLNSPYANIQLGETVLPLTLFGFAAYSTLTALSLIPTISGENESESNENNRIAILGLTTAMATFSSFLISLLFNTLHQSCPYCLLSAGLSISMGFLAWISGALPMNRRKDGVKLGLGSFLTTTVASLAFFLSVDEVAMQAYSNDIMQANGLTNSVVASAKDEQKKDIPAPPVTATSSQRALDIGDDLKNLNAKMFGAYWCSHCYEQKQRLGKEAFVNVQYMECSKEGLNSKADMCKERKVPGYPTWEINGNLYPGDMYLDELEDIIKNERKSI